MWLLIFKSTLHIVCIKSEKVNSLQGNNSLNPFTPMSDQDRISPCNINTISSRQPMRIKTWPTVGRQMADSIFWELFFTFTKHQLGDD